MFYGTKKNMKSVTAAELAAAGVWRVLDQGDRPGAIVFDDGEVREVRAHRSRRTALQVLHLLVEKNNALSADSDVTPKPSMLNEAIEGVARRVTQNCLIALISDFDGADADSTKLVTPSLSSTHDLLVVPVLDPSSSGIPEGAKLVVSDGELQIELDTARSRRRLAEMTTERMATVMAWQEDLGVPVLPVSTAEDSLDQIRLLLGRAVEARAR